jgi:hypothetical protein
MKKHYLKWSEKKKIVDEALRRNNIKATARDHKISPAQIWRWKKEYEYIVKQCSDDAEKMKHVMSVKMMQKGRPWKADDNVYESIYQFYTNLRDRGVVITAKMLSKLYRKLTNTSKEVKDVVIKKRIHTWRKTVGIVYRRVTHVAQNTRHDGAVVEGFVKYVNEQNIIEKFTKDQIVNIDETNIYFDMTGKITLADCRDWTVSAMSTGCTNRCTVLLGATMSGKMLPPFIVFVGSKTGRIVREWKGSSQYPQSCLYTVQQKGWIDKETFLEWIKKVWQPFCIGKESTYLLMDEFAAHMSAACTREIENCGSSFDFIYGGYTGKLQVLDVGVNKQFKDYVREGFDEFQMDNVEGKKPSRLDVAHWITAAYKKVTADQICNTWDKIGYKV